MPNIATLEGYLESLGCELWPGEAFYLTDPKSRAKAAEWFARTYQDYELFRIQNFRQDWAELPG